MAYGLGFNTTILRKNLAAFWTDTNLCGHLLLACADLQEMRHEISERCMALAIPMALTVSAGAGSLGGVFRCVSRGLV